MSAALDRRHSDDQVCQVDEDATFYVIQNGQKAGPFNYQEVKSMVDSNELLVTDQVSIDQGNHWLAIYQIANFDRRQRSAEELPGLPGWDVFTNSDESIHQKLKDHSQAHQEVDAIAGLAFIENIKSGKAIYKEGQEPEENNDVEEEASSSVAPVLDFPPPEEDSSPSKKYFYGAVFVFSLMGLIYLFIGDKTPQKVTAHKKVKTTKSFKKAAVKLTPTKSVGKKITKAPRRAPVKRLNKGFKTRKPQSFTQSKAFKDRYKYKRKMADDALEEDFYYDDSDPIELDPIRNKLAKETIDPEENYNEEMDPADSENVRVPASNWPDPDSIEDDSAFQETPDF